LLVAGKDSNDSLQLSWRAAKVVGVDGVQFVDVAAIFKGALRALRDTGL
jgi:hypothetical protein